MDQKLADQIIKAIDKMEGWCTNEKALYLAGLIIDRAPSKVVEIGIFGGRSLIPMAMAMKAARSGEVWGIDPWSVSAATEGDNGTVNDQWWAGLDLEKIYTGFISEVIKNGLTKDCRWMRCKGEEAIHYFRKGSVDILHQDSNHSELVSCRQVEQWEKKMSKNSVWVLDDTDWPSQAKAMDLIISYGFVPIHSTGQYMAFERKSTT